MKKQIQVKQKDLIVNIFIVIFFIFQFNSFGQGKYEKDSSRCIYKILNSYFSKKDSVYLFEKTINIVSDLSFLNDINNIRNWHEAQYSLANSNRSYVDIKNIISSDIINRLISTLTTKTPFKLNKSFLENKIVLYKEPDNLIPNKLKYRTSNIYKFIKNDKIYIFIYIENYYSAEDGYGGIYLFEKDHNHFNLIFEYSLWIS